MSQATLPAVAELGERQTEDLKVPSSILGLGMAHCPPAGAHRADGFTQMVPNTIRRWRHHGCTLCGHAHIASIAQLGERQTEHLKVPSSILGLGMAHCPLAVRTTRTASPSAAHTSTPCATA